jgi:hypothetical protein
MSTNGTFSPGAPFGQWTQEQLTAWLALDLYPPRHLSQPCRREWRRGAESAFRGEKLRNPWARTINGRNYHQFEFAYDAGYKACQESMTQKP